MEEEWAADYAAARRNEAISDSIRFKMLIKQTSEQISWVLAPEHRVRKLEELMSRSPAATATDTSHS